MTRKAPPSPELVDLYRDVRRQFADADHERAFAEASGRRRGRPQKYGPAQFAAVEGFLRADHRLMTHEAALRVAEALARRDASLESVAKGIVAAADREFLAWLKHRDNPARRAPIGNLDNAVIVMAVRKDPAYKANADLRFPENLE